jgi:hypothetical protein
MNTMTSLLQTWEHVAAREHAEFAGTYRYLLSDASQLPMNAAPWPALASGGSVVNLLDGQPEAANPEVCALLCEYSAPHVEALLARHLVRRPFAFIALVSAYPLAELATKLAVRTRVTLPDDRDGLLRFYDAAVFQTLAAALSESRWHALLSPCVSWTYVCRDGEIGVVQHPRKRERIFYPRIEARELEALQRGNRVDAVLAELKRNGRIAVDADPFAIWRDMRTLMAMLDAQAHGVGGEVEKLAYRLGAIVAMYPGTSPGDPAIAGAIDEAIGCYNNDHDALCEAVHDVIEERHAQLKVAAPDTEIQQ